MTCREISQSRALIARRFGAYRTVYTLFDADLARYVEHRPSILYWIVTSGALFGEIGMGLLRAIKP